MKQYNLSRFREAQKYDYETALQEIRSGKKRSHWIWYIFAQLKGLGYSSMSEYYGIDGMGEAKAYMQDDVLRAHLLEITQALNELEENDAGSVMGYPDDLKLKSSMTLFEAAAPDCHVFGEILDKYFHGERDWKTLELLENEQE